MIRKWLKFNTSFIELLKNSTQNKWQGDFNFNLNSCHASCSSINTAISPPIKSASVGTINRSFRFFHTLPTQKQKGDGEKFEVLDPEDSSSAVAKTPANTQLFEIKGPKGSAFLVEVFAKDLDDVKNDLIHLKGNFFKFDKTVIKFFSIKCLLTAKPIQQKEDQKRLVKVHAIASGSDKMYELDRSGEYLFSYTIDRAMRAKRMLEKFGYNVTGILYRFQPKEKVNPGKTYEKVCNDFITAVERLPKVLSVTHNL